MNIELYIKHLAVAIVCGFLIGLERQWKHKAAGMRTNILVALGAAIFVIVSVLLKTENNDVTRIVSQIVTGVGFLGAGLIFRERSSVHGLTTAATIWCTAAVGSLAGFGYFYEAIIATVFILVVNLLLRPLENWISKK
ncbi:MgtC/SapB family protein [Tenacibaculum aquimarinum]|uniref:MgtC/SapB family protein n=1 Tax=Tenacibaculum aquimarinum TaxID=2910675 RepID=UPI001F0A9F09|nr:MgtC/SapB family protein [Tenacibaculum aquimarinum]MCH3884506.1 MgtC/SapB family protein [Tenacibaculum aquimarinum]